MSVRSRLPTYPGNTVSVVMVARLQDSDGIKNGVDDAAEVNTLKIGLAGVP